MTAAVTAGAGFLLAVLWFDFMFDVQVLRHRAKAVVPEPVLASIAGYYARVTTGARPMNAALAVGIAAAHTVPAAVRLGRRSDPPEVQSALARSICRDHLVCLVAIASVLVVQLAFA